MGANRVLVVEDDVDIRDLIARTLEHGGYECEVAGDVSRARLELARADFDLLLCDLGLPGENGLTLVKEADERHPQMAVLIVTAESDPKVARLTAEYGAYGYLVKPFKRAELLVQVAHALGASEHERLRIRESEERIREAAEGQIAVLRSEFAQVSSASATDVHAATLIRLTTAIGLRDVETGAHIRRIGAYSRRLAELAGLPAEECERIGSAAPMHDVGKVAIPDSILLKPTPLNSEERELMRTHAQIGAEILADMGSELLDLAAEIALTHHERWDGAGYPRRLAGEEIPLSGRIVAIADSFDAMISDRPYRRGMPATEAAMLIDEARGTQFDADLACLLVDHPDDFIELARHATEAAWTPGGNGNGRRPAP